jgi:hypothetical protein
MAASAGVVGGERCSAEYRVVAPWWGDVERIPRVAAVTRPRQRSAGGGRWAGPADAGTAHAHPRPSLVQRRAGAFPLGVHLFTLAVAIARACLPFISTRLAVVTAGPCLHISIAA